MEAITRCEDLLSQFAEREKNESANSPGKKRESANSLRVSSHGLNLSKLKDLIYMKELDNHISLFC